MSAPLRNPLAIGKSREPTLPPVVKSADHDAIGSRALSPFLILSGECDETCEGGGFLYLHIVDPCRRARGVGAVRIRQYRIRAYSWRWRGIAAARHCGDRGDGRIGIQH